MTSYLWTSFKAFQVAKPYDQILEDALDKGGEFIKLSTRLYLGKVNKNINAFKIGYDGTTFKIETPKYKIKRKYKHYTLFEVIT